MKSIFIALFFFGTLAQAKNIPIFVQCDTTGPLYEGTISLPDQFEGKCVYDKKENKSEIYQSKSDLTLQFNNLIYATSVTTYRFVGSTCDLEHLRTTGPTSSDLLETHSGYGGRWYLQNYGGITGDLGSNCHFMEKY